MGIRRYNRRTKDLQYSCKRDNLGTDIRLRMNRSSSFKIREPQMIGQTSR